MEHRVSQDIWREGGLADEASVDRGTDSPGLKLTFEDVCYVLFRHKGKIVFFTLLGLCAAAALYYLSPRLYQSEAMLMVKYVTEVEPMRPAGEEGEAPRSPVLRGETVVNAELAILQSEDLALKVAQAVGPERILANVGGGSDLVSAARVIKSGTLCDVPRRANVIHVVFQHPDPTIVQPVLSNLVDQYFLKHSEIHQALTSLDDFAEQRKVVQERLDSTEQSLLDMKRTNGVFALDDAKRTAANQVARIQETLSDAEVELEAREAAMKALQSGIVPAAREADPQARELRRETYENVVRQLDQARRRKVDLMGQFLEGSSMVAGVQADIARLEAQKRKLEREDPNLLLSSMTNSSGRSPDGLDEAGRITVLQARVGALRTRLEAARREQAKLSEVETPMIRLQRAKDLEESRFRHLSAALQEAQIDSGLGASRPANISRVQNPTAPSREVGPLYKRMAGLAGGGLALGLVLALLMEFFVDQTIKRPIDFRRAMSLPLYLAIPRTSAFRTQLLAYGDRGQSGPALTPAPVAGSSRGMDRHLQPYVEALRDRILNRFETLARKPKLVGVCGVEPGAGVTSIAAGLASSLSESGDLKVLLVDMKRGHGRAHPMLGSRKSLSLIDALEGQKRQEALIAPNLYLASANGAGKQEVVSSPRKFTTVVPQLNASDYDYIVFDMPPVNDVSITPRLAKHMDLTLMVVEAERTRRNAIHDAGALLLEFTQNVAVVLNKTRAYLPKQVST